MLKSILATILAAFVTFGCQTVPDVECQDVFSQLVADHQEKGRVVVNAGTDAGGIDGAVFSDLKTPEFYLEIFVPPTLPADYPDLTEAGFVKNGECVVKSTSELGEAVTTVYSYWSKTIKQ